MIDWVESSLGVDEMVCLHNLGGMIDRAKSLSGSIVTSSFCSSLVKRLDRRGKASAIMSLAPGTWVKILLKRGKSFVQQVCRLVRHHGSRC